MPIAKEPTKIEYNFLKLIMTIMGRPKLGKTTFVSNLGRIVFFCTEPGHKFVEIIKWQTDSGEDPTKWEEFKQCVMDVTADPDVDCLAIDTVDNLFTYCTKYVLKKHNIAHESDLGFGKGYKLIQDEFHGAINYLVQKGKGVIFITHAKTTEKNERNKTFTYTDVSVPETCKKVILPISDLLLYATVDQDGNRVLITKGSENINAGDRSGLLPESIPLDPEVFKSYFKTQKAAVKRAVPRQAPDANA